MPFYSWLEEHVESKGEAPCKQNKFVKLPASVRVLLLGQPNL